MPGVMLLVRSAIAAVLVLALRAPSHMRRYILGAVMTMMVCWTAVVLYLVLSPPTYSSRWTFILPTSSSNTSLQVESIGHASTNPSSPFGSSSLSPKVIYKEIIGSERVRLAAANTLGMSLGEFGAPQVRLIDETSLLLIEIRGRAPESAQMKANALIQAFNEQLDTLRNDEIRRRAEVVQQSLKSYQLNLQSARERILEQQRVTGVLSLSQFSEASTSMELMRRRLGDVRADHAKLSAEQERLTASLGMDSESAGLLLQLSGDPAFTALFPNRMFRNAGGKFFQDVTTSGGFGNLQKGHGVSFADLDNDGDQDVHEDMGGAMSSDVYPNVLFLNPGHGNHWLKLQLAGVKANRSGLGARLKLTVKRPGGERVIHRTVNTGGSFGGNPLRQEIGLGDATSITSLEIRWPGSGTVQTLTGLQLDTCYRVREDAKQAEVVPLKQFSFRLPDAGGHHHH